MSSATGPTGDATAHSGQRRSQPNPEASHVPFPDELAKEEEAISVAIPPGRVGELRCAFKAGCDCMGVIYARAGSSDFHTVGNCHDGTQTGDRAAERFGPGVWNFWVYNKSRSRFEKMMKKLVPLDHGSASFVLGATHRISAEQKTCIVCVLDMVPERPARSGMACGA